VASPSRASFDTTRAREAARQSAPASPAYLAAERHHRRLPV